MRSRRSEVRIGNTDYMPLQERTQSTRPSGASAEHGRQASSLPFMDLGRTRQPAAMSLRGAPAVVAGTAGPPSLVPSPFFLPVLCVLVSLIAIGAAITQAGTTVSGQIAVDQRWTAAMSPILLEADVAVWSDAGNTPVLTIDPGVVVKAAPGTALIIGSGTWPGKLYAVGTSSQRITFSANGSTARGAWRGIWYDPGASSTSLQQYTNVTYAGGGGHLGAIHVNGSKPQIKNTSVKYSSTSGIFLESGAAPVCSSNSVSYTTGHVASFDGSCRVASFTSVTGSSTNGTNMVEARGGLITGSNETWRKLSVAYHLTGPLSVWGSPTTTTKLSLSAGVTIKASAGAGIQIGDFDNPSNRAALYAVGTATNVVKLMSDQATIAPVLVKRKWEHLETSEDDTTCNRCSDFRQVGDRDVDSDLTRDAADDPSTMPMNRLSPDRSRTWGTESAVV